jgi:HAD superfamily hydrolase (TIGR01549 family)
VVSRLNVVFLDVGGPLYGDRPYYEALLRAIQESQPDADESAFWAEFQAARRDQRGPFTRRLVGLFADESEHERLIVRARELWHYEPEDLQPDVPSALEALKGSYRLGILANQQRWIRDVMARDGIDGFFDIWAVSDEVGAEKPDSAIFEYALREAGVPAGRCAMVGDRLDNDVAPARAHGMRGIWMLRGEAPDDPSAEQLARADAAVRSLQDVPATLELLGDR